MDPAYAGMNLVTLEEVKEYLSGPRVCGDEPIWYSAEDRGLWWTPRMRG